MNRKHKRSRLVQWAFEGLGLTGVLTSFRRKVVLSAVMLSVLPPREGWVLRMYDLQGMTLSRLARDCGVTREVLARLHRSACRRLDREYDRAVKMSVAEAWRHYLPGARPWDNKKRTQMGEKEG